MTVQIANDAGEVVASAESDAEAVRWFHAEGRRGDHLVETGEYLADLSEDILGIAVRYDRSDCVVVPQDA